MYVTFLEVRDFRNYTLQQIEPIRGLNLFVGENAQGKSNLLESLYVLATTKSSRAGRDSELIRFDAAAGQIRARVVREKDVDLQIELMLSQSEKKAARLNGVRHTRMTDVIGQVNAVLFDSNDLETIRGEPSVRRRFLDLEVSQTSPRYAHALAAYKKTLEQRNHLLRAIRDGGAGRDAMETLAAWNQQFATYGSLLMDRRRSFLTRLNVLASEAHRELSDGRDDLDIGYQPSFRLEGDQGRDEFLTQLAAVRRDEVARGTSLIGPQRDDITFSVSGADARLYASQGQQRTIALSVKLAERRLIEEVVGEPPLLLLDDVLSDLDDRRRRHLFETIGETGSQTFVTCTNLRAFPEHILSKAAVFTVAGGVAVRDLSVGAS